MRQSVFGLYVLVFGCYYVENSAQGQCPAYSPNFVVKQGFRLYGHVINWLYAENEVLCRLKCNMVEKCLTFNYEAATKICELNDANHTLHINDLRQTQGFVYVDLKKQKKSDAAPTTPSVIGQESPIRSYLGYCVQPKSGDCNPIESTGGHALILKSADKDCSAEYMKFILDSEGIIHHKCSGKIVCPEDNRPWYDKELLLVDECPKEVSRHKRLPSKSLQNINNRFCVHPRDGYPKDNKHLVYYIQCNANRLILDFIKLPSVQ
ncbi:uncharacterized protein LOC110240310 [Exaiptasia diaphana]|uniref:Apple domain-containing protein n=1 Tax=Exaiptasia diaphana TaxID=2652724 RepID=A0A913XB05_EXADI|nr:uncharacterized protein LOC110240310 [Exaiptasia diaphana]